MIKVRLMLFFDIGDELIYFRRINLLFGSYSVVGGYDFYYLFGIYLVYKVFF